MSKENIAKKLNEFGNKFDEDEEGGVSWTSVWCTGEDGFTEDELEDDERVPEGFSLYLAGIEADRGNDYFGSPMLVIKHDASGRLFKAVGYGGSWDKITFANSKFVEVKEVEKLVKVFEEVK